MRVRIVGAAVSNSCKQKLVGNVTSGHLEQRHAISALSLVILALAGLWVYEYVDTRAGGAAQGVETELNMGPYRIDVVAICPGWRLYHLLM